MPIVLATDSDIQKGASGRVTNKEDYNIASGRYRPGGLYDPIVFGSCMKCSCGATSTPGVTCVRCKERVVDNATYATSYAYYDLTIPYIASYKLPKFTSELQAAGIPCKKFRYLKDIWSTMFWYEKPEGDPLQFMKEPVASNELLLVNIHDDSIRKLRITDLPDIKDEDADFPYDMSSAGLFSIHMLTDYKTLDGKTFEWIDQFINYKLPITSPAHRPISKLQGANGKTRLTIDARTIDYRAVIAADELMEQLLAAYPKLVDQMTACWLMNTMVDRLFTTNPILGSSKENMFRTEVTTRVSESLRANITSVPDLAINQILIPRSAAYEALNKKIIDELKKRSHEERDAIALYLQPSPEALEIFNEIIDNSLVTLVRNPSLHRLSMQAFYPILWDQVCIGIPGLVCEAFNADFDGDQMWVIFHTEPDRVASMRDLLSDKLWFYEKEYRSQFVPKAETLHGLYQATKVTDPDGKMLGFMGDDAGRAKLESAYKSGKIKVSTKIAYDNNITTYGRVKLSEILGMDFNSYLGLDKRINGKTIAPIISILGYKDDKVERLRQLQIFGNETATLVGLGTLPFMEMYDADAAEVAKIVEKDTPIQVKQDELRRFMMENIKKNIDALPDSNLEDAMASGAKLKMQQLLDAYAPAISDTGEIVVDGSKIFSGLSEMQYNAGAEHYRKMLSMKQDMVSVPGYGQRQLANLALSISYDAREASPDTTGILLKEKDARGRTKLDGSKVPQNADGENLVRVKSCISNGENKIYADELALFKFSGLVDGAALGVSFGNAITEEMQQKGLSLKHGGDLFALDSSKVVSPISGKITKVTEKLVSINDGEYTFKITTPLALSDKIKEGNDLVEGQLVASSTRHKKADNTLSCWNSLVNAAVYNGGDGTSLGLPQNAPRRDCVALRSGILKFEDKYVVIEGNDGAKDYYEFYDDEIYYYPEGYRVELGQQFCTGVPNLDNIIQVLVRDPAIRDKKNLGDTKVQKELDFGMAYNIFFNYISNLIGPHNSEIFELVFKLICNSETGFSVAKKNKNNSNFVNRMYYGWAKDGMKTAVLNSKVAKDTDRYAIDIEDSILLPLLLGSNSQGTLS